MKKLIRILILTIVLSGSIGAVTVTAAKTPSSPVLPEKPDKPGVTKPSGNGLHLEYPIEHYYSAEFIETFETIEEYYEYMWSIGLDPAGYSPLTADQRTNPIYPISASIAFAGIACMAGVKARKPVRHTSK